MIEYPIPPSKPKKPNKPIAPSKTINRPIECSFDIYERRISFRNVLKKQGVHPSSINVEDIEVSVRNYDPGYDQQRFYILLGTIKEPNPHYEERKRSYDENMIKYEQDLFKYKEEMTIYGMKYTKYLAELEEFKVYEEDLKENIKLEKIKALEEQIRILKNE